MKLTHKISSLLISITLLTTSLFAFEQGWVLNMRGNVGGSLTTPFISEADLDKLSANKMEGMVGFLGGGTAEVGYIFDNETYFNLPKDHVFSGLGLFGRVGVTQGYSGLVSGSQPGGSGTEQIDVFVNIYFTPVITLGASAKAYFFKNRLAVGVALGTKMIADTAPTYEMYSQSADPNLQKLFPPEVGTIIVDDWMMKNMNPFSFNAEILAEYNVKILPTTELILGGYIGYNIYSPKYVTFPPSLFKAAVSQGFNPKEPLRSYFLNSFDFGLTFALGFKLD